MSGSGGFISIVASPAGFTVNTDVFVHLTSLSSYPYSNVTAHVFCFDVDTLTGMRTVMRSVPASLMSNSFPSVPCSIFDHVHTVRRFLLPAAFASIWIGL